MNIIDSNFDLLKKHLNCDESFMLLLSKKVTSLKNFSSNYDDLSKYDVLKKSTKNSNNDYFFSSKTSFGKLVIFITDEVKNDTKLLKISITLKEKNKKEIYKFLILSLSPKGTATIMTESLGSSVITINQSNASSKDFSGYLCLEGFNEKYRFLIYENSLYTIDNINLNITVENIYNNLKEVKELLLLNNDYTLNVDSIINEKNIINEKLNSCYNELTMKEKNPEITVLEKIKKMLKYKK